MGWQILTVMAAVLFTKRAALFVLGVVIGGMLTVTNPSVLKIMEQLVDWWEIVMRAVLG